jgi:hypothetical protein
MSGNVLFMALIHIWVLKRMIFHEINRLKLNQASLNQIYLNMHFEL